MTISVAARQYGNIGEIRFSKPPFNYACPEMLRQIADAIDGFDDNPDVRAILLYADGKNFCAGADLAGDKNIVGTDGMDAIAGLYAQATRIFSRKKPLIAAIQGGAIGAGLGLAVSADFRIAAPSARLSANFARLGFHPGFALTYTLPRLVGPQHARWMALSAERVKPDTALRWGLVDRLSAEETLLDEARAMTAEIAENAPLSLIAIRATMTSDFVDSAVAAMKHEHAEQSRLKASSDYAEGVASVFERRAANFTGS